MTERVLHTYVSTLADDEIRKLFHSTLENPADTPGPYADFWRSWLVSFALEYFSQRTMSTITDQCRYVALALRYMAAIEACNTAPYLVQQVLFVMENRPEVSATLLFGTAEDRKNILTTAFDPAVVWEMPSLAPFQEVSMQEFMERFQSRKNVTGQTFDDSTVAKWSRDLIPELESEILEYFRPVRRLAQNAAKTGLLFRNQEDSPSLGREPLLAFVDQFENDFTPSRYGLALAALNDFDRRTSVEEQNFQEQRKIVLASISMLGVSILAFVLGSQVDVTWLGIALVVIGLLAGIGFFGGLVYSFVRAAIASQSIIEHVTRTRSDIQTLQQLADRN